MTKSILVTGAAGFVGTKLCDLLVSRGYNVCATVRKASPGPRRPGLTVWETGDINEYSHWELLLRDCSTVIHLAARAHILNETAENPIEVFRRTNTEVTLSLARAAVKARVSRFIFVSTAAVIGNKNMRRPINENDPPNPIEPYAISKWEAEQALQEFSKKSGLQLVIVRPPGVYGANNPGNFLRLLRIIKKGVPLPLASVHNKRSFINVYNLCDFLIACIHHPKAAGKTFLISDGENASLVEIMQILANGMGCRLKLFPFPVSLLRFLASLIGKESIIEKLCETRLVDSSFARNSLDWRPVLSLQDGLLETAKWYVSTKSS